MSALAYIHPNASIGQNVEIGPFTSIAADVVIRIYDLPILYALNIIMFYSYYII
jgi:NDP-sugar pyrophosphorylase family protein